MNIKSLIFAVVETIIKVVVVAVAVMFIIRGVNRAYDFGYRVFADEPVSANNGRTITVGIAEDATISDIATMLEEKGLIEDANLFIVQERLSSYHDRIKPGIYDLSTGMTATEMLQMMSADATASDEDEINNPEEEEHEYYDELSDLYGDEYNEGLIGEEDIEDTAQ